MSRADLATLAATATVSLAVGFGAATLMPSRDQALQPIINANAWDTTPSAVIVQPVSAPAAAPRCSQWAISDVAMEEVLDEMIRRGWRPPNQGEAIDMLEDARTVGLAAVDPSAPMPSRGAWNVVNAAATDAPTDETPLPGEAAAEPAAEAQSALPPA